MDWTEGLVKPSLAISPLVLLPLVTLPNGVPPGPGPFLDVVVRMHYPGITKSSTQNSCINTLVETLRILADFIYYLLK